MCCFVYHMILQVHIKQSWFYLFLSYTYRPVEKDSTVLIILQLNELEKVLCRIEEIIFKYYNMAK